MQDAMQFSSPRAELALEREQEKRKALATGAPVQWSRNGTRIVFRATDLIRPSDVAKLAGVSNVVVCQRYAEGKLPPYDVDRGKGRRFWWGATLNEWESPLRRRWLVVR